MVSPISLSLSKETEQKVANSQDEELVKKCVEKEAEQKVNNSQDNEKHVEHKGYSYSIGCSELLNPEELVKKILEPEKLEYQKDMLQDELEGSHFAKYLKKEDSYWENQEQLYLKIEKWIRETSNEMPSWQVAGPLNYGMSLEQMKDAITKKFKDMASSGNLIAEEQLSKKHDRKLFYPTTGKGDNNLTRIWGAEFLKSNLLDNKTLNAAEHFLILDDSVSEIEVQVYHRDYPYLCRVNNAYVLSQKIEGTRKAWEYRSSGKLNELGYRDFSDPGNIICDSKGTGWVVDTELKSFDSPELDRNSSLLQGYLKKRFKVLAGNEYHCLFQTFKISVADLKLK